MSDNPRCYGGCGHPATQTINYGGKPAQVCDDCADNA